MANDRSRPTDAPAPRRAFAMVASLLLLAFVGALLWFSRASGSRSTDSTLPPVTLMGERAGVMVWGPVAEATTYRVEVLDKDGKVLFAAVGPDTVAPLPPSFMAPQWSTWWVRAYADRRELAASPRTAFY
jgi:hypothetical protein